MAAVMLTSCSNEDVMAPSSGGNVSFTAQLPSGINTRSYADGTTATKLTYALYDEDNNHVPSLDGTATFNGLKSTINLNLVTGKTYTIVFWADAPDNSYYTFDTEKGTVSVSDKGNSQDEKRDAFFAHFTFTVNGSMSEKITLTRPFAQINIGTSDYTDFTASGESVTESGMVVKAYSALNLLSGNVEGDMNEYTFSNAGLPADSETFPYKKEGVTYKYLTMNYILIGEDKETVDVTWTSDNASRPSVTFYSVPVQRNYRTNIFGALLTNPAEYDVEIKPGYDGSVDLDQNAIIADGVYYNETDKTYSLTSKSGLDWLVEQVNGKTRSGGNSFEGYTVKLLSDIDLAGVKWTPLGNVSKIAFEGVFDGCGSTISNMTVDDDDASGFFRNAYHVKNLNFKNATVTGHYKAGVVSGDGLCSHIENCHVDGGTITVTPIKNASGVMDDGNNVGGITGYLSAETEAYVKDCSVKNMTITAYRKVGGIIGAVNRDENVTADKLVVRNNVVENVKIIANMTTLNYDGAPRDPDAGEVIGAVVRQGTIDNNTFKNVTVSILQPEEQDGAQVLLMKSAADFETYAEVVNSGASDMFGITIKLDNDINFDPSIIQQPLGKYTKDANGNTVERPFAGTFDGNGHTITGFTTKSSEYKLAVGFIGYANYGATVTDLKLKDITVEGTAYAGGLIGMAYKGTKDGSNGYVTVKNVEIDNITVTSVPAMGSDGKYDGGNNVGALVGLTQFGMHVEGCKVTNATITGYVKVGGMIGTLCNVNSDTDVNHSVYKDNSISDSRVIQSGVNAYDDSNNIDKVGEFYGYLNRDALPESNTASNVTVTKLND